MPDSKGTGEAKKYKYVCKSKAKNAYEAVGSFNVCGQSICFRSSFPYAAQAAFAVDWFHHGEDPKASAKHLNFRDKDGRVDLLGAATAVIEQMMAEGKFPDADSAIDAATVLIQEAKKLASSRKEVVRKAMEEGAGGKDRQVSGQVSGLSGDKAGGSAAVKRPRPHPSGSECVGQTTNVSISIIKEEGNSSTEGPHHKVSIATAGKAQELRTSSEAKKVRLSALVDPSHPEAHPSSAGTMQKNCGVPKQQQDTPSMQAMPADALRAAVTATKENAQELGGNKGRVQNLDQDAEVEAMGVVKVKPEHMEVEVQQPQEVKLEEDHSRPLIKEIGRGIVGTAPAANGTGAVSASTAPLLLGSTPLNADGLPEQRGAMVDTTGITLGHTLIGTMIQDVKRDKDTLDAGKYGEKCIHKPPLSLDTVANIKMKDSIADEETSTSKGLPNHLVGSAPHLSEHRSLLELQNEESDQHTDITRTINTILQSTGGLGELLAPVEKTLDLYAVRREEISRLWPLQQYCSSQLGLTWEPLMGAVVLVTSGVPRVRMIWRLQQDSGRLADGFNDPEVVLNDGSVARLADVADIALDDLYEESDDGHVTVKECTVGGGVHVHLGSLCDEVCALVVTDGFPLPRLWDIVSVNYRMDVALNDCLPIFKDLWPLHQRQKKSWRTRGGGAEDILGRICALQGDLKTRATRLPEAGDINKYEQSKAFAVRYDPQVVEARARRWQHMQAAKQILDTPATEIQGEQVVGRDRPPLQDLTPDGKSPLTATKRQSDNLATGHVGCPLASLQPSPGDVVADGQDQAGPVPPNVPVSTGDPRPDMVAPLAASAAQISTTLPSCDRSTGPSDDPPKSTGVAPGTVQSRSNQGPTQVPEVQPAAIICKETTPPGSSIHAELVSTLVGESAVIVPHPASSNLSPRSPVSSQVQEPVIPYVQGPQEGSQTRVHGSSMAPPCSSKIEVGTTDVNPTCKGAGASLKDKAQHNPGQESVSIPAATPLAQVKEEIKQGCSNEEGSKDSIAVGNTGGTPASLSQPSGPLVAPLHSAAPHPASRSSSSTQPSTQSRRDTPQSSSKKRSRSPVQKIVYVPPSEEELQLLLKEEGLPLGTVPGRRDKGVHRSLSGDLDAAGKSKDKSLGRVKVKEEEVRASSQEVTPSKGGSGKATLQLEKEYEERIDSYLLRHLDGVDLNRVLCNVNLAGLTASRAEAFFRGNPDRYIVCVINGVLNVKLRRRPVSRVSLDPRRAPLEEEDRAVHLQNQETREMSPESVLDIVCREYRQTVMDLLKSYPAGIKAWELLSLLPLPPGVLSIFPGLRFFHQGAEWFSLVVREGLPYVRLSMQAIKNAVMSDELRLDHMRQAYEQQVIEYLHHCPRHKDRAKGVVDALWMPTELHAAEGAVGFLKRRPHLFIQYYNDAGDFMVQLKPEIVEATRGDVSLYLDSIPPIDLAPLLGGMTDPIPGGPSYIKEEFMATDELLPGPLAPGLPPLRPPRLHPMEGRDMDSVREKFVHTVVDMLRAVPEGIEAKVLVFKHMPSRLFRQYGNRVREAFPFFTEYDFFSIQGDPAVVTLVYDPDQERGPLGAPDRYIRLPADTSSDVRPLLTQWGCNIRDVILEGNGRSVLLREVSRPHIMPEALRVLLGDSIKPRKVLQDYLIYEFECSGAPTEVVLRTSPVKIRLPAQCRFWNPSRRYGCASGSACPYRHLL